MGQIEDKIRLYRSELENAKAEYNKNIGIRETLLKKLNISTEREAEGLLKEKLESKERTEKLLVEKIQLLEKRYNLS